MADLLTIIGSFALWAFCVGAFVGFFLLPPDAISMILLLCGLLTLIVNTVHLSDISDYRFTQRRLNRIIARNEPWVPEE